MRELADEDERNASDTILSSALTETEQTGQTEGMADIIETLLLSSPLDIVQMERLSEMPNRIRMDNKVKK